MNFTSKLIETAVQEIAKLPGIGTKTAFRLVLHLLKSDLTTTQSLSDALLKLRTEIRYCRKCFNIADDDLCSICTNPRRETKLVCVVENIQDVLAIENTGQYFGVYHVLGGVISPMEGVSPSDLHIEPLLRRVKEESIEELIFALNPTMEGDTTTFYITKKLKEYPVKVSTIARGIPIGSELEYTDEITLGRSILARTSYE